MPALADQYGRADWTGWKYISQVFEEVMGRPIPPEQANDREYLLTQLLDMPIAYGPARGRRRNPEPIQRLIEMMAEVRRMDEATRQRTLVGPLDR